MSLDADQIVDRRRMRRKLTFWRIVTVLVAILAIGALAAALGRRGDLPAAVGAQISRVTISGVILGNRDRVEALTRLSKSSSTRAVIVHIDSPGGTVPGSEQLYHALRLVAENKPTVVVVDGLAASGGYMAAMASDHIIAQDSSIVGSIGVLYQYPNVTDLLKTVGVQVETIRSTPLKAQPDGFEPTSPLARAAIESMVMDMYAWFQKIVEDRRKLTGDALAKVVDGRVFTGRQGLEVKLVDEIGDEQTAIDWLAKQKGIDSSLPVRDWRLSPRFSELSFLHVSAAAVLDTVGLGALARRLSETGSVQALERLNLDGLLALWHPSATN
ncbi:MAG TPA: signal peptide peptidase SppA [Xanthobacteraceae bacterium]|nr:signal peptide peptidase SppA [Xanthobacteraceae bacterium]